MTDPQQEIATLREELAAKTRELALIQAQLACPSASCGVCRACVLRRTEVERDRAIATGDTLRADLQKQTKRARDAEVERDKLQNRLAGTLPKGGHDSSPALVVERLKDRLIAKAGETVEQAALRVVLESDRRRSDNQKLREDLDSERAMNATLTQEGDTLRAQLADLRKQHTEEVMDRQHAESVVEDQNKRIAELHKQREEARSRLTACEPVFEIVRRFQDPDTHYWNIPNIIEELRSVSLPAKVTT